MHKTFLAACLAVTMIPAYAMIARLGVSKSAKTSEVSKPGLKFWRTNPSNPGELAKENYKIVGNHIMANGIKGKDNFNDGDEIVCTVSPGKRTLP